MEHFHVNEIVEHPSPARRIAAIHQATAIQDQAAIPFLWKALDDTGVDHDGGGPWGGSEWVAQAAIRGLKILLGRDGAFVARLREIAESHEVNWLRIIATDALVELGVVKLMELKKNMWTTTESKRDFLAICSFPDRTALNQDFYRKVADDTDEPPEIRQKAIEHCRGCVSREIDEGRVTLE